jgi:hypothetical protein
MVLKAFWPDEQGLPIVCEMSMVSNVEVCDATMLNRITKDDSKILN